MNGLMITALIAIVAVACNSKAPETGKVITQSTMALFDPLKLPKKELASNDWLDPTSFFSDQAYTVQSKRGTPRRKITKTQLLEASTIKDLIPEYPDHWITDHEFTEIIVTSDHNETKTRGKNDSLTEEQKRALQSAPIGSRIDIAVVYKSKNAATDNLENSTMRVSTCIVPEMEAQFIGGQDSLIHYLKENALKHIAKDIGWLEPPTIAFYIDSDGHSKDAEIVKTSGNVALDGALIEIIEGMPAWSPAKDVNGNSVKQAFEFLIGQAGC